MSGAPTPLGLPLAILKYLKYFKYMSKQEMPQNEVRANFTEVINQAIYNGQSTVITRRGKAAAAIVPIHQEHTMSMDAIIQSLAEQVRDMQVRAAPLPSGEARTHDAYERLDTAETMLAVALRAADGERGTMDFYGEWAGLLVEGTPDAIGLSDLASGTPRKGGDWRSYRPADS